MNDALEWICESVTDMIDDLEHNPDDDEEGVPLVPIMECACNAMDDKNFLKLLRCLGFQEPSDEQVLF